VWCLESLDPATMTVEHVAPRANGGSDREGNRNLVAQSKVLMVIR
jgi:hypothetical protein